MTWWSIPTGGQTLVTQVVVCGAGAGGAVAACVLAEAGLDVLLLEEGFEHRPSEFPDALGSALVSLYQEGGMRTTEGTPPVPLPSGKGFGGSTLVNSAICFRTPQATVDRWNEETGGMIGGSAAFFALQDQVERVLGVAPTPEGLLSGNDRAHREAARALGWREEVLRRNASLCQGCGRCNAGCTVGGKNSVDRVLLPRAAAAGCRVFGGCAVKRASTGQVSCEVVGSDGEHRGPLTIRAEAVVLALGAVSTPRILLDGGTVARGGAVGSGLRIHPVLSVHAMTDRLIHGPGATQGHGITEFVEDDILLEANPSLPGAWFQSLPLSGRSLQAVLARGASIASTGALIRDRSDGRVMPSLAPASRVSWSLGAEDRDRVVRGGLRACELWLDGLGAEWVLPSVWGAPLCKSMDDVRRVLAPTLEPGRLSLYASHPQASCGMGRACDADGALVDLPGVFVADASALPSNVGRNPQISVMTLAARTAFRLAERLGGRPRPLG